MPRLLDELRALLASCGGAFDEFGVVLQEDDDAAWSYDAEHRETQPHASPARATRSTQARWRWRSGTSSRCGARPRWRTTTPRRCT
jgi:hypothetical protein